MVSENLMSGSLSKSMGPAIGHNSKNVENKRKRHKSAGDHTFVKTRSNSLFSSWRHNSQNSEDKAMKFSELIAKEEKASLLGEDGSEIEKEYLNSEMQDISEEIKDSGVGLDENEVGGEEEDGADRLEGQRKTDSSEVEMGKDDNCESKDDLLMDNDSKGKKLDSITEIKSRSGSLKSATSSPLHAVATPVTENDPLGLFMGPEESVSAPSSRASSVSKSSPEKVREQFVSKKPFEGEVQLRSDAGKCNNCGSSSNEVTNRVGNTSGISSGNALSPVHEVHKNRLHLERTNSFPENLGNSLKGEATPKKSELMKPEVASLGRSSSSLHETRSEKSSLFRTGSFRRHKNQISGMLKFATGAVANKLSELKVNLTPSKLGSNTSLTPSCEDLDSDEESYREASRKKGSLDFLHRSIDRLDSSSINGLQGKYFLRKFS